MSMTTLRKITCNRCGQEYPNGKEQQESYQNHESIRLDAVAAGWSCTKSYGEEVVDRCGDCKRGKY